jgi:hypothetical protein
MNREDLKPGMIVLIESPHDRDIKAAALFPPHPQVGRIVGLGIHPPVAADTGFSDMVTVDMGGGCHVYCYPSWLRAVKGGEDPARTAKKEVEP